MKNIDEQIAKTQAQINQLTNKKKRLISEQKQAERKKWTKRLIERGAILESVIGNAAELWRSEWTEIANKYLEQNSIADRIDHRSFERQGTDQIPTIHLGVAASQMERKGITTERGNINREIKAHNRILAEIKAKIASLKNWLADIFKRKEKQPPEQNLIEILQELSKPQKVNMQYRIYNPKKLAEQIQYLQDNKIFTVAQLDETVNSIRDEYDNIRITLKEVEGRLKSLAELVKQAEIYRRHRDLYKQYHSLSGNKADMFRIRNYTEIALYEAAEKYLKENVNGSTLEVGKWKSDIATLTEQKRQCEKFSVNSIFL